MAQTRRYFNSPRPPIEGQPPATPSVGRLMAMSSTQTEEVGVGECRDCARWTIDPQDSRWGACRLPGNTYPRMVQIGDGGTNVPLRTRATFGCQVFTPKPPPEPAAPDWQALAERRGAALAEMTDWVQAEIPLSRVWRRLPDLERWKAARDAGPEAR